MKLVVLESPNKTRTVKQYLDSNEYLVLSCNGHINDLAKTGDYSLGIDLKTFSPHFVLSPEKKAILTTLKKFSYQAETIFLATDPDREGEAISYHLANYFAQPKKIQRVFFNEITKNAVQKSFQNPSHINQNLVESQITRRLLDRIIGFRLSQFLQKNSSGKTAGRVQSVSLKLIVDLEKEIKNFVPQKSWNLLAKVDNLYPFLLTHQLVTSKQKNLTSPKLKKIVIKTEKELKIIQKKLDSNFQVTDISKTLLVKKHPLPLNTANLIQIASNKFKFSIAKTMSLAQKLYEGIEFEGKLVALITYPRSDSRRISADFYQMMSKEIKKKYGEKFLGSFPKKDITNEKIKVKIQDAHESIHITGQVMNLAVAKTQLPNDLYKLYELIYFYSFATLMTDAQVAVHKFVLENNSYYWQFIQEKVVFEGYSKILPITSLTNQKLKFPNWKVNDKIKELSVSSELKVTKPKTRYSEGKLIKTLEGMGIGRPSTYAAIVPKLIKSGYVTKEENRLFPSLLGDLVNENLVTNFLEIINEKYTAKLEKDLNKIAEGKEKRKIFLKKFYDFFAKRLTEVDKKMQDSRKMEKNCPECDNQLQEKVGRFGKFIACSGYPECQYIEKTPLPAKFIDKNCPKCKKQLQEKTGRFGKFNACSGYPECQYIEKTPLPAKFIDKNCPKCKKQLQEKTGRFGKFNACSGYPECQYIEKTPLPAKFIDKNCPKCKKQLQEKTGRFGKFIACSGYPECRYLEKKFSS